MLSTPLSLNPGSHGNMGNVAAQTGPSHWAMNVALIGSLALGPGEALELMLSKLGSRLHQGVLTVRVLVSDVDFVTALCSQVVYEGLVDDTFRIKCGKWHLGKMEVVLSSWASYLGWAAGRDPDSEQTLTSNSVEVL